VTETIGARKQDQFGPYKPSRQASLV